MHSRFIQVDFSKKAGRIKPLFSSPSLPVSQYPCRYDVSSLLSELNVGTVRLRPSIDLEIGISDVFPDPDLDPRLEASYNFRALDAAASLVKGQGMDIYLSLGERADVSCSALRTLAPRDPEKWAEICVGIIRHLNEGFAGGFKYGIKYVEIWPEADSLSSFRSSPEEFYELYTTVATRLKEHFPRLRVGGYSCKGFYSLNHVDGSEEEKRAIDFLESFLDYISARKAPLDFLSWQCYATSPEELALHSNYAASYLVNSGYKKALSIVSGFNLRCKTPDTVYQKSYPAFLASSLIIAEKSSVDMLFYSDLSPFGRDNGLFSLDDRIAVRRYGAFGAAKAFGELFRIGTAAETGEDYRRELYTLAAGGRDRGALLIVTGEYNGQITVELKNSPFTLCSIVGLTGGGERGSGASSGAENIPISSGRLNLKAGRDQVYLISFE